MTTNPDVVSLVSWHVRRASPPTPQDEADVEDEEDDVQV